MKGKTLVASCMGPDWGLNPQFGVSRQHSDQLSYLARPRENFLRLAWELKEKSREGIYSEGACWCELKWNVKERISKTEDHEVCEVSERWRRKVWAPFPFFFLWKGLGKTPKVHGQWALKWLQGHLPSDYSLCVISSLECRLDLVTRI